MSPRRLDDTPHTARPADRARRRGRPAGPATPVVSGPVAALLDAALIVLFAALGRRSHGEADALTGLWHTAWPFLVGAALGWVLVAAIRRRPANLPPDGLVVWPATVAGGMVLRALTGAGVAPSFVGVATVVTALFLLGWRLVVRAVELRRSAA